MTALGQAVPRTERPLEPPITWGVGRALSQRLPAGKAHCAAAAMAHIAKSFYDLSATDIHGEKENCTNEEILNSLKHVRPGAGFEPNFTLFQKCQVNGQEVHPVFAYLKAHLPAPADEPSAFMGDPKFVVWSPVRRDDLSWNFEKFLVGPEGEPFKRYSPKFQTVAIEPDIQRLLKLAK
ncbi:hypothetical protein KIL84_007878 [Mauremys mutica]|uniref:glutathione peroxidase n=1 Tax=Mauremys mutica TaxID=74926 RepID=A0A9D4AXG5_9SAUR|nr:hypothetical protein KIL84_007878 [Mauremys mutica]